MAAHPRPADKGNARARMLDAAERLFAEYGIDGVSLRQIGAATGQANNSAVQYHFGDKAGLVREIIARRVAALEPRRQALFDQATAAGRLGEIRTLLAILFLPIAEAVDAGGRHVYAQFMLQYSTRFRYRPGFSHPGLAAESAGTRAGQLLAKCLPFLDEDSFTTRLHRIGGLFVNALIDRDNAAVEGHAPEPEAAFLADLFNMMEAAVKTPLPQTE
jgi:TetR/AcrR family transcriptional regulator, regulator of cefoperazone and chloramphenicol sensitivity